MQKTVSMILVASAASRPATLRERIVEQAVDVERRSTRGLLARLRVPIDGARMAQNLSFKRGKV